MQGSGIFAAGIGWETTLIELLGQRLEMSYEKIDNLMQVGGIGVFALPAVATERLQVFFEPDCKVFMKAELLGLKVAGQECRFRDCPACPSSQRQKAQQATKASRSRICAFLSAARKKPGD